ncbi:MAG: hypothetical protein K0Q55_2162, partial [Verrucomicrobia bacterium]|nr:hypothetical protein [Verrucomicrobiota bacterium]
GLVQNQYEFVQASSTFQVVGVEPVDMSRLFHHVTHELDRRITSLAAAG